MSGKQLHAEPSLVEAVDGEVALRGPEAVDIRFTPEAAEETGDRLIEQAVVARGQRRLRFVPRPK